MDNPPSLVSTMRQYTPAVPATLQLSATFWPSIKAALTDRYCPMPDVSLLNCSDAELDTTPPHTIPVGGSIAPAYDSKVSFTSSRIASSINLPPGRPTRIPAVQF